MSSGLSRRRVPNSSPSSSTPTLITSNAPSAKNHSHAGSAFQGGSKIAYDPKDLEADVEELKVGGKVPRLTLMEEVLLLGIKDKQVRVDIRPTP
jgi:Golgi phosphoprotein 3